jgi:hypothetical protein
LPRLSIVIRSTTPSLLKSPVIVSTPDTSGLGAFEKLVDPVVAVPRDEVARSAPPFVVSVKETVPVGDPEAAGILQRSVCKRREFQSM